MHLNLKTIINFKEKYPKFKMTDSRFIEKDDVKIIQLTFEPKNKSKGICSLCDQSCPCYDHLKPRSFNHIDLWGIATEYLYRMRRVSCSEHGITVEKVPWSDGKSPLTLSCAWHLSEWVKLLSIEEVARRFKTSWHLVFNAVAMAVIWGRANMDLTGITALGVDEIYWSKGKFMTLVYQIDVHCRRLIWCGEKRTEKTLNEFFDWFGEERALAIKFICSDMWKPYLNVIKAKAKNALNILDRFHISQKLNEAIDKVRAEEIRALLKKGKEVVLRKARYILIKNPENLNKGQKIKLKELLACNLKSIRAYLLKEDFKHFWTYKSTTWAGNFLDEWCTQVMRSKIEPMKKVAKTIKSHKKLIMNWFEAKDQILLGAVEGQNNKAKVVIRKSYGFRTADMLQIMLYQKVGQLPVPDIAHRYF